MREMKDSGVAWVGDMPEGWNVKRGKFTLKLLSRPIEESDEVITCFRDGEVTLRKNRREDGFTVSLKEIGYQGLEPGDLVIHGMDGFAGSIGISDSRGKSSPVLVVCDSDENKKYIMYYLRSMAYNDVFTALATGIRVRSCDLRWNKLAELPYILPCLDEQEEIVRAIDVAATKIDALISNNEAQIEKLKQYKQSLISEVVTKGLDPTVPMKDSGVEWIGEIPEHWSIERGKNVLMLLKKPIRPDDEVVTCFRDGEVTLRKNRREEGFTFSEKEIGYQGVDIGDLCVHGMDGFAGAIGISDSKGKMSPIINVLHSEHNKKYIMYYLRNLAYRDIFVALSTGIRVRSCDLRWNKIASLKFIIPTQLEQKDIVDYLDTKCTQIDRLIAIKQAKIEKLNQYKKSLIYEYVTGKKEV